MFKGFGIFSLINPLHDSSCFAPYSLVCIEALINIQVVCREGEQLSGITVREEQCFFS